MRKLKKMVHIDVAGVLIEKEGKFLLVQEGFGFISEMYEKWNLPMGRMEKRERPYKCALRESRETTGLLIKIENKINADGKVRPYRNKDGYIVRIGPVDMFVYLFEASIIGGEIKIPSDILDVGWFSFEEIENLKKQGKLVNSYILSAIADYNEIIFKRKGNELKKELQQK